MLKQLFMLWSLGCLLLIAVQAAPQLEVAHKAPNTTISKVHIVFMNHLDVGYSDGVLADIGFVSQVLNRYFTKYFPTAINTSHALISEGYVERFVYTTHPWLVSMYLDCPNITLQGVQLQVALVAGRHIPILKSSINGDWFLSFRGIVRCPSESEKQTFRQAIRDGHIAWHAAPMNLQTDNFGADLFGAAIDLSMKLDEEFGFHRTYATMSQRDVPGIAKGIIPVLMSRGVKAISVGVNGGTAPPAVPSPCLWKLREDDEDGVMAFWLPGGYPDNPGLDPANPGGLAKNKCIMAEGLDEALCFAFRTDNTGPPVKVEEVLGYYEILRPEFPGAELVASTFDNFTQALERVKPMLPVYSFEVGDTWIQGIASDPKKSAMYRAFERTWVNCKEAGQCFDTDKRIGDMLRYLMKLPEHTWGAHNFLDNKNWTNEQLDLARKTDDSYKYIESTWKEQRQFLDFALQALQDHPLKNMVEQEYENMKATTPDLTGFSKGMAEHDYRCPGQFIVRFGRDGSLVRLYDPWRGREWASPINPLGQLIYDTYDEQIFTDMGKQYNYKPGGAGYDKPNVTQYAHPERKRWEVTMLNLYVKANNASCEFWVEAMTADNQTRTKYGAPQKYYVHYVTNLTTLADLSINVTLQLMGKVTTRLPESLSFGFSPALYNNTWSLDKLGQSIDPCNVVLNGSQYVHAIDAGVRLVDSDGRGLQFLSEDVPIVTIGTKDHVDSPFPVPLTPLPCSSITNMSFNIYNNIWNTNYIFWYPYEDEDADFKARFVIKILDLTAPKK